MQTKISVRNQNRMANNVDPDETAHNELSYQDLQCLHRYLIWSAGLKGLKRLRIVAGDLLKHFFLINVSVVRLSSYLILHVTFFCFFFFVFVFFFVFCFLFVCLFLFFFFFFFFCFFLVFFCFFLFFCFLYLRGFGALSVEANMSKIVLFSFLKGVYS